MFLCTYSYVLQRRRNKINTGTKKRKQPPKVVKKQTKKTKHVLIDSESTSEFESEENKIEKTPVIKRKQLERVAKTLAQPHKETKQAKDNAVERRKRALEMIREKRSKKRNDGAQSANIASDQFDFPQAQNEFS
ncbi:hypothetical protein AHAS_Ahas10G0110100 [Arachis hypogaea]